MGFRHIYEKEKYWSITSDFCNFSKFQLQCHQYTCTLNDWNYMNKETLQYFVLPLSRYRKLSMYNFIMINISM